MEGYKAVVKVKAKRMFCRGTAEVIRGGNNRAEEARKSNSYFLAAWPKLLTMKLFCFSRKPR